MRELKDSIQIIHSIKVETAELNTIRKDSIEQIMLEKLKSIEAIENYEKTINKRISGITSSNEIYNAKFIQQYYNSFINPDEVLSKERKGFSIMPYFETDYIISDCPKYDTKFVEIVFQFADTTLYDKTACVLVRIKKEKDIDGQEDIVLVADKYYVPNKEYNVVRFKSPFYERGTYSISFGIILKKDVKTEFPEFHKKTCFVSVK